MPLQPSQICKPELSCSAILLIHLHLDVVENQLKLLASDHNARSCSDILNNLPFQQHDARV